MANANWEALILFTCWDLLRWFNSYDDLGAGVKTIVFPYDFLCNWTHFCNYTTSGWSNIWLLYIWSSEVVDYTLWWLFFFRNLSGFSFDGFSLAFSCMKHMKQDVFEQLGPEEKMISMGLSCMSFSWMISVTFTKKKSWTCLFAFFAGISDR